MYILWRRRAKFKDTRKAFEAFDGPDGNGVLGLREFEEGMRCRAGAGIGKSKKKLGYKQPTTIYVSMIFFGSSHIQELLVINLIHSRDPSLSATLRQLKCKKFKGLVDHRDLSVFLKRKSRKAIENHHV
jgi:hypothetical protein